MGAGKGAGKGAVRDRFSHTGCLTAMWLSAQEDAEDVVASEDALAEYRQTDGIDADIYFQRLVAEGRIEYPERPRS